MILEKSNEVYKQYRIPSIVSLKNGDLVACYECRTPQATDWGHIDVKIVKSTDGGETWRTVKFIDGKGFTMNNPVLTVANGKIHFTYCKNYHDVYHMVSNDGGESFSDEEFIPVTDFEYTVIAVGPGHGIYHNGAIIMPIWFVNNLEDKTAHFPSKIATMYLLDEGKTWKIGEVIGENYLESPSECALAVNSKNQVVISIRNISDKKQRAFAVSETGYDNWKNLSLNENFTDPICQGSMVYDDKFIYHINCCDKDARQNLTLKVIDSDFNIIKEFLIDKIGGYADITLYNNEIFVLYEQTLSDWTFPGLFLEKIKL